ncbi:zinc ribbon domain-containing protein [Lactiplantibacillus plantarum]|uniref:zinc ribbon domain-containing protein n=1 Tax=Lactiplantibacillus plantarum TaxID=1590 RepID=UPI0014560462|nr:zinc ribbon domain-containing protein [Lactiplantibacillus plantarum]MCT4451572.1 zinc ribbon domain-containing protein [Lactiplantibacillus plantarum]MCT4459057.1 zinc ribbon domain-containing protein [Lactiplantibacillus plantarum]NLS61536.1 zinc ribbon domain-containing protein [Lactiplantibacillus plantarum]
METDMKNCVVCGERIPQSAQYCEKCGSRQPTVAEDKRKDAETTTLKQPHHQKKSLRTWWFWLPPVICALVIVYEIGFNLYQAREANTLAANIQSEIRTNKAEYGKVKVSWNGGAMRVRISKQAPVIESVDQGKTASWQSLAKTLQSRSEKIAKNHNQKYSHIEVLSPKNTKYMWLEVNHGKMKFNIANQLN